MKEYWEVPKLVGMIAAILDPRLKNLKFVSNNVIKTQTITKLRDLYSDEKLADESDPLNPTRNSQNTTTSITSLTSNSIIAALLGDDDNNNVNDDINEVDAYLSLQVSKECDPSIGGSIIPKDFLY